MLLLHVKRLEFGRHRDRLAARQQSVAAVIETHDLLDALDADIDVPSSSASDSVSNQPRAASGAPSGPSIGAISASAIAGRSAVAIDDAAAKPAAFVAQ